MLYGRGKIVVEAGLKLNMFRMAFFGLLIFVLCHVTIQWKPLILTAKKKHKTDFNGQLLGILLLKYLFPESFYEYFDLGPHFR